MKNSPMSMRKKTSGVWSQFTIIDVGRASCNICHNTFSFKSTISNLKKHLTNKHKEVKIESDPLKYAPKAKIAKIEKEIEFEPANDEHIENNEYIELEIDKSNNIIQSAPVVYDVAAFTEWPNHDTQIQAAPSKFLNNYKIDKSLLDLFVCDFQPVTMIEGAGFKSFVKALNPSYKIPTKERILETLIPNTYAHYINDSKEILNGALKVCITFDNWASKTDIQFMTITAHFIDSSFNLNSLMLDCLPITDTITTDIDNIINEWEISDKIKAAITCNSRNIKNSVRSLGWKQLDCFANIFNEIIQDSMKPLSKLLDSTRTAIRFTNSKLKSGKITLKRKLILEETSQWNLVLEMLQDMLEHKAIVARMLVMMENKFPILKSEDWNTIQQLVEVLKPFQSVINSMGEVSMASMIIVLVKGMLQVCDKLSIKIYNGFVKQVVCSLQTGLTAVFDDIESDETLAVCTILDPRFKTFAFSNKNYAENAKRLLSELILERFEDSQTDSNHIDDNDDAELSIWNSLDSLVTVNRVKPTSRIDLEIQRYIEEDVLNRNEDPIKWWKDHQCYYHFLGSIVRECFCVMATSVPARRIFSKSSMLLDERRKKIPTDLTKSIVFMHSNSHLMSSSC